MWPTILERLELSPSAVIEDGLVYLRVFERHRLEVHHHAWRDPASVRIVIRPARTAPTFLLVPRARVLTPCPEHTGDPSFDSAVAILSGERTVLYRLGGAERESLQRLIGDRGATVGSQGATLEPAVTATFTSVDEVVSVIEELAWLVVQLSTEPDTESLLERWLLPGGAPGVALAVSRRITELLPDLSELQAERACRTLLQRSEEPPVSLVAAMPPYPVVLRAWFRIGDPLDPRIAERVVEAWRQGAARPTARYIGWLLARTEELPGAEGIVSQLWSTPGLSDDPDFVRELVRSVRHDPPIAARPLLQQLVPRSSTVARRLARVLASFSHPQCDARLIQWLQLPGSGIRRAAAAELARRAAEQLEGSDLGSLDGIAEAARSSGVLVAALVSTVPRAHTAWLAALRPHGEPDAIVLIRRLGEGGALVDETLLYWLDRGTRAVRLAAVDALATAGSAQAVPLLRERAMGWFGDSLVRERCRAAADAIGARVGGVGNLAIAQISGGQLAEASTGDLER
ncbi:MAG TPA: hypothetical protein ENK18_23515 [Deltaproteobacteria bacterium]|nr:hypothetical protein [Deltaproteobacteria bacterium]